MKNLQDKVKKLEEILGITNRCEPIMKKLVDILANISLPIKYKKDVRGILSLEDLTILFKVYGRVEQKHSPNVYFMTNRKGLGKVIEAYLSGKSESLTEEDIRSTARLLHDYCEILGPDAEERLISGYKSK